MTIQDAHKLNKGVKIRVNNNYNTEVESTSISEVGPIIWYYDEYGSLQKAEAWQIEEIKSSSKEEKFIQFLDERIKTASCVVSENAYRIVKDQFKLLFHE